MALIAVANVAWGQLPTTPASLTQAPTYLPAPTPITASCIPAAGPLAPTPGQLYTYTVSVDPAGSYIHWFVTTDPAFMSGGQLTTLIETVGTSPYLMATGSTYNHAWNGPSPNTTPTVDITWQAFAPNSDVFLVTYAVQPNGCTDNIKVYKIEAVHRFTLDIATLTATGTQNLTNADCLSPVQGANYDAGTGTVIMDYGVNYVYFVVNAANWAHSWKPRFQLDITNTTTSTSLAVDWAYPNQSHGAGAIWHSTTATGNIYLANDFVAPAAPGATGVGAAGEYIIVRLTVDHNQNETIADMAITFAVDGTMYDQVATNYTNPLLGDIHHADVAGQPCPWYDGFTNDFVNYTLTRRPTVNAVDPTPFLPTNAD